MSPGHRDGRRNIARTPKRASMSTIGHDSIPRGLGSCYAVIADRFQHDSSSMLGALYRRVLPGASRGSYPRRDTVHHLLGGDVSRAPVGSSGGWPVGWPSGQPSGVVGLLPIWDRHLPGVGGSLCRGRLPLLSAALERTACDPCRRQPRWGPAAVPCRGVATSTDPICPIRPDRTYRINVCESWMSVPAGSDISDRHTWVPDVRSGRSGRIGSTYEEYLLGQ
jgi:hypothetical protein